MEGLAALVTSLPLKEETSRAPPPPSLPHTTQCEMGTKGEETSAHLWAAWRWGLLIRPNKAN